MAQINSKTSLLFGIVVALMAALAVWTAGGDLRRLNLWVCVVGPLLGVMLGIYGGIAGGLLHRGRARRPVMTTGLLFLAACLGMALGGVILFLMGRPWMFAVPWLIVGGVAGLILAPLLCDLRRRYDKAERQRFATPDPSRVDHPRTKVGAAAGLLLALLIFIWSASVWEKKAGPDLMRWAWLPSALAGVVSATYVDIAWRLARKAGARKPVMTAGALLFLAYVGMLVAALVMLLTGHPYEYCWPWLVPGAVGSYAFAWALWRLRRYYEGAHILRVQARDIHPTSDVILPLAMGTAFVLFLGVLFWARWVWGIERSEYIQGELFPSGVPLLGVLLYWLIGLRLAQRGRARKPVMAFGLVVLAGCVAVLLSAIALLMAGRAPEFCLPWLFTAGVSSMLCVGALRAVSQRYHEAETRRLSAKDISSA